MPTSTPPAKPTDTKSKATPQQKRNSRIFALVAAVVVAIGALVGTLVHRKNVAKEVSTEAPALAPGHGAVADPGGDFAPGAYDSTDDPSDPMWKPKASPLVTESTASAGSTSASASASAIHLLGAAAPITGVSDKLPPNEGTRFALTYYFIALRPEGDADQVKVLDCKGGLLTWASRAWYADLSMEGTGRYRDPAGDSQTINVSGMQNGKACWEKLDYDSRWGLGVTNPSTKKSFQLRPFRSIAVDRKVLTMGAWYYIAELDGVQMPYPASNVTHDGCVRAMDVGPGITGKHIDFYSAYESAYKTLVKVTKEHITLWSGQSKCAIHVARGW